MKTTLNRLFDYQQLTADEAELLLFEMTNGKYSEAEIAAFITVFNMRTISIQELNGFRNALLKTATPIDFCDFNTIDIVGTGGDGKDTFNISTLAAFIVAGAGGMVTKHGNYGASSVCGSSNVMEQLGYQFSNNQDRLRRELEQCGITFLHAPLFNAAMKNVAHVRRALKLKTFFNMLGPMVNPCRPKNQMLGVFNLEIARIYNYCYQQTNTNYCIVHSLDGYDEISLTGNFKILTRNEERIVSPLEWKLPQIAADELAGANDVAGTAKIFINVLTGKGTVAQNATVIANAGRALATLYPEKNITHCIDEAYNALHEKKALQVFTKLISVQ